MSGARRHAIGRLLTLPLLVASLSPPPPPRFSPPVDAPVLEAFRAPTHRYGPGNRGIDYATPAGTPVRSIGGGVVVFAGVVARQRYVTILHAGGLRSSYSWLTRIDVQQGELVRRGQPIGLSGPRFQLGVRSGDTYIDPSLLFARSRRARLVAAGVGSESHLRAD